MPIGFPLVKGSLGASVVAAMGTPRIVVTRDPEIERKRGDIVSSP